MKRGCRRGKEEHQSTYKSPTFVPYQKRRKDVWNFGKHELGLTPSEAKEFIANEMFGHFNHWMRGQTVGVIDGVTIYYRCDVDNYLDFVTNGEPYVGD
jgi:hypothetical protein